MQSKRRSNQRKPWRLYLLAVAALLIVLVFTLFAITTGLFERRTLKGTTFMLEEATDNENDQIDGTVRKDSFHVNGGVGFRIKEEPPLTSKQLQCRFETCFDLSACRTGFRVFSSHPGPSDLKDRIHSPIHLKILLSIRQSMFHTPDPSNACLYVPTSDTIDRDKLSKEYVRKIEKKLSEGDLWNRDGRNFLLFNLFSGTWPDYSQSLSFDFGDALLAKASLSEERLRHGFDVSLPLFQKDHPQILRTEGYEERLFPLERKYRLAFKGKRYLFGIGSEVRDMLHLLHNGNDAVLLTTCKHGKNWQNYADARCSKDNQMYESHDYQELLYNATFCLVPRGRRLGSFRFLESLQAGCIPVVMSDGWELPFSSVIDWSRAVIHVSEKSLLHVPSMLRSISKEKILSMRQQGMFLYYTYLSAVQQIVSTTLKIIHDRVEPHNSHSYHIWNYPPGALNVHTTFSTQPIHFPFYHELLGTKPGNKFTAVILVVTPERKKSGKLFRLIRTINLSEYVHQILVIWLAPVRIPEKSSWPRTKVSLRVIYPRQKILSTRFLDSNLVQTDAIFAFNDDVSIHTSAIDFAFRLWRSFPDQLVGFTSRDHYWDPVSSSWVFTSKISNTYSTVMMNVAIYHRYYNHLYTKNLPKEVWQMMSQYGSCEDLTMNFLVSDVTRKPPIVISPPRLFVQGEVDKELSLDARRLNDEGKRRRERFKMKQNCFRELVRIFGKVTLKKSMHKLDPLLFKDPISNFRKRYRDFE